MESNIFRINRELDWKREEIVGKIRKQSERKYPKDDNMKTKKIIHLLRHYEDYIFELTKFRIAKETPDKSELDLPFCETKVYSKIKAGAIWRMEYFYKGRKEFTLRNVIQSFPDEILKAKGFGRVYASQVAKAINKTYNMNIRTRDNQ